MVTIRNWLVERVDADGVTQLVYLKHLLIPTARTKQEALAHARFMLKHDPEARGHKPEPINAEVWP